MIRVETFGSVIGTKITSHSVNPFLLQNTDMMELVARQSNGEEIVKMEFHT